MLPQRINNPLAPAAYNGLSSIGDDYEDKGFSFLSDPYSLTANQTLLNQSTPLDKDADFIWCAVQCLQAGLPFGFRFSDASGYYLSDGFLGSFAFAAQTGIGCPYVLPTQLYMPAGSAIIVDLQEQSGNLNGPIQFLYIGMKRYRR